ncbi:MAG TPA: gamma-glutamyltransferase family protein [Candidatus Binataceae bacterium]|nr:gamma-glutamyltransferase family protein [Candidatus Binataceae bacterium]
MTTIYPQVMGREAMVSTEHYLSASAGARIFARGGNAIDAAVAATLVEGVVNPHMHTIGGEAPMLIYVAKTRQVVAVNGNMTAPARATIDQYRALNISLIPAEGLLAAGVPAAFDALASALREFGTLTLAEVVEPALKLCEDGMPMHAGLSGHGETPQDLSGLIGRASLRNNERKFREKWPSSAAVYMPNGELPYPGEIIKNPALTHFFRRLLEAEATAKNRGRESAIDAARERFYRGDIAREIVRWSEANGGLLQESDLAGFSTRFEQAVAVDYHGVTVHKCQPWSQGPVFLQQLRLLEGLDLRRMGHNSADYIHYSVEAAKLAFADREAYYGDPEFTRVPLDGLLSHEYADLRRPLIDPRRASMDQRPGDPVAMRALADVDGAQARSWGAGTIHVTAADGRGNMVACTASGGWIPSSPVIDTLGFPLGSRMQTFFLDERHPNALRPGKRPRTTLTPSLATRDGEPFLSFGTPGGDQQDQWTLQFFLNLVDFGMDVQEAIEAPRFSTAHFPSTFYPHNVQPGVLRMEERIGQRVADELAARGHKVQVRPPWCEGHVLGIRFDPRRRLLEGGADPRGQLAVVMAAQAIGW